MCLDFHGAACRNFVPHFLRVKSEEREGNKNLYVMGNEKRETKTKEKMRVMPGSDATTMTNSCLSRNSNKNGRVVVIANVSVEFFAVPFFALC